FIDTKYHGGLNIVAIVLFAKLFQGIFYNLSVWYKLTDKTHYGAYIAILGVVITITMNVSLVPIYGYMGAAWGQFACFFTMMIFSFVLGRKHFKVTYPLLSIGRYVGLALAIYFLSEVLPIQNNVLSLTVNAIMFIIFVAVAFFSEKDQIRKFST
ncbi:MAG: polysaccharide biosynthesis C-terminal domain-containing protein, partial [Bacteroidales bacterium]|nr:polysaccharide biosynthesis C-terminal domain-containing protein [Bacteroidales bacterium]